MLLSSFYRAGSGDPIGVEHELLQLRKSGTDSQDSRARRARSRNEVYCSRRGHGLRPSRVPGPVPHAVGRSDSCHLRCLPGSSTACSLPVNWETPGSAWHSASGRWGPALGSLVPRTKLPFPFQRIAASTPSCPCRQPLSWDRNMPCSATVFRALGGDFHPPQLPNIKIDKTNAHGRYAGHPRE